MNAWHRAGRSIGRRVAALATLILLIGGIPSAQASPGDLDTGFSSDGKVLTDIGSTSTVPTITMPSTTLPPSDGPPPLPPMTIIDGRLYQDGGIPLPPYYLG